MRTAELAVTKFNISVVVVNSWNAIIYKFFRGILLRMHERSTHGVFRLAIEALYMSLVNCKGSLLTAKSKTTSLQNLLRKHFIEVLPCH